MIELVLLELIALPAEQSRGRRNPRVVKRKMSNFPTKARAAPVSAPCRCRRYAPPIQIVAPAVPPAPSPVATAGASAPPTPTSRSKAVAETCRRTFWLEHVRAWWTSNLPRTAYCERHHLEPRTFNAWVASLRHRFRRQPTRAAVA